MTGRHHGKIAGVLGLAIVVMSAGCSPDMAQRTAYETMQNVREQQCLGNSAMECGKRQRYDDYQRQRKALDSTE